MGLDMWLRAKTTKRKYKGTTGACSGLFNAAPDDQGMIELGYWRKGYVQDELIMKYVEPYVGDDNCQNLRLSAESVDAIIKDTKDILATHIFNKDGFDITEGNDDVYTTWMAEAKWKDTLEFFTAARDLLKEDPDAQIYYCTWY